jgi:hypothetical protein
MARWVASADRTKRDTSGFHSGPRFGSTSHEQKNSRQEAGRSGWMPQPDPRTQWAHHCPAGLLKSRIK